MSDFINDKPTLGAVFPDRAVDGQDLSRVEPLITPQQLRRRQLLGIPLVSFLADPITGKRTVIEDEDLQDFIARAITETELETGLVIIPTEFKEKKDFNYTFWRNFGYLKTDRGPISDVLSLTFTPANGQVIFQLTKEWIESANFHKRQLSIIPMVPAASAQFISGSPGSATGNAFLTFLGGMSYIPAIIQIDYIAGFPNGQMPRVINEVIGINAALEVLGLLAATNKFQSASLGIDGLSQSQSGMGPQVYSERIKQLEIKKKSLVNRLKNAYALNIFSDHV